MAIPSKLPSSSGFIIQSTLIFPLPLFVILFPSSFLPISPLLSMLISLFPLLVIPPPIEPPLSLLMLVFPPSLPITIPPPRFPSFLMFRSPLLFVIEPPILPLLLIEPKFPSFLISPLILPLPELVILSSFPPLPIMIPPPIFASPLLMILSILEPSPIDISPVILPEPLLIIESILPPLLILIEPSILPLPIFVIPPMICELAPLTLISPIKEALS
ncbi:hypothetical protein HEBU111660_08910 [Helicobacter burdigaliensis]